MIVRIAGSARAFDGCVRWNRHGSHIALRTVKRVGNRNKGLSVYDLVGNADLGAVVGSGAKVSVDGSAVQHADDGGRVRIDG